MHAFARIEVGVGWGPGSHLWQGSGHRAGGRLLGMRLCTAQFRASSFSLPSFFSILLISHRLLLSLISKASVDISVPWLGLLARGKSCSPRATTCNVTPPLQRNSCCAADVKDTCAVQLLSGGDGEGKPASCSALSTLQE